MIKLNYISLRSYLNLSRYFIVAIIAILLCSCGAKGELSFQKITSLGKSVKTSDIISKVKSKSNISSKDILGNSPVITTFSDTSTEDVFEKLPKVQNISTQNILGKHTKIFKSISTSKIK